MSFKLQWQPSDKAEEQEVYRDTQSVPDSPAYPPLAVIGAMDAEYTDTSPESFTKYYYRVAAVRRQFGFERSLSNQVAIGYESGPSLSADFVNQEYSVIDGAGVLQSKTFAELFTYTSASPQEYFGGEMVVAEQNLFWPSANMVGAVGGIRNGAVNNGDGTITLTGATQDGFKTSGVSRLSGAIFGVSAAFSGTGKVRLSGLNGSGSPINENIVEITLTSTPTRYFWSGANTSTGVNVGICVRGAGDGSTATVKVEDIQFRDDHLNVAYVPTTTAPITRYQPKLSVAPPNVPFFSVDPVTGEKEGLGARGMVTNLVPWSSEIAGRSGWGAVPENFDIKNNTVIGVDGLLSGLTITCKNPSAGLTMSGNVGNAGVMSFVVVVKEGRGGDRFMLRNNALATIPLRFQVNYANRTASISTNVGGSGVVRIVDLGNGWLAVCATANMGGAVGNSVSMYIGWDTVYGAAGDYLYLWRGGIVAGDFFGIPPKTEGSQVTRTAAITSMSLGSFYNPSKGALSFEGSSVASAGAVQLDDGTTSSRMYLTNRPTGSTGTIASVIAGGVVQADLGATTWQAVNKLAMSYKADDIKATGNLSPTAIDSSATIPTGLTTLRFFNNSVTQESGFVRRFSYYPKALSASELEALTRP